MEEISEISKARSTGRSDARLFGKFKRRAIRATVLTDISTKYRNSEQKVFSNRL